MPPPLDGIHVLSKNKNGQDPYDYEPLTRTDPHGAACWSVARCTGACRRGPTSRAPDLALQVQGDAKRAARATDRERRRTPGCGVPGSAAPV